MVERGIIHIEDDRLLSKVEYGVIRLHRHAKEHVVFLTNLHLMNALCLTLQVDATQHGSSCYAQ